MELAIQVQILIAFHFTEDISVKWNVIGIHLFLLGYE